MVAGILAGLGIYLDLTGPFGRLVRSATGALLGQGKVLVPVILVANVPARILTRAADPWLPGLLSLAAAALLALALSRLIWKLALRRYSSASS